MPKAYSIDLRERLVEAYYQSGESVEKIALQFKVGRKTIYRYVNQKETTGDLTAGVGRGSSSILGEEEHAFIKELVRKVPDIELETLCEQVGQEFGKWVSVSTMCRHCQELNLRRKKLSFHASEHDKPDVKKSAKTTLTQSKRSNRRS